MASACPMPSALSGIEMATWKALTGAGLALSGHKFKQCKQDDQAIILRLDSGSQNRRHFDQIVALRGERRCSR
jgi:hypothetical protein